MSTLIENWLLIGNNYYIIYHFYNMAWEIENLKDYFIAHEQYGGSIAVVQRNPNKQKLSIYSASGREISSSNWKDAPVIGLHWSDDENLFLLQKSGILAVLNLHCEYVKPVFMGESVKKDEVRSFRFFNTLQGTGLMVLTEKYDFFYKTNLMNNHSSIVRISGSKQFLTDGFSDWVVYSWNNSTTSIVAHKNELVVFENGKDTQVLSRGYDWYSGTSGDRICRLSLSLCQQKLAMLLADGRVLLLATGSALGRSLAQFQLDVTVPTCSGVEAGPEPELPMEWAGPEMLALHLCDNLHFLDLNQPGETTERFYMDDPLMFPEIDGVRIITVGRHEFAQKIPTELEQLCQFRSDSPSVWLFDAQQYLETDSYDTARFLEQLKQTPGQLQRAIDLCLAAAGRCLEPRWQKSILGAVRLGRSFLPQYKSVEVAEMHRQLSLLNNLKLPFVAMPLTLAQLMQLTVPVLLDRLTARRYYPLVERLCRPGPDPGRHRTEGLHRLLHHWTERRIRALSNRDDSREEEQLANELLARLDRHRAFDFARPAELACKLKKDVLAQRLAERETRVEEQVKILLLIGKKESALSRAVDSGSAALISDCVSRLKDRNDFSLLIERYPAAKAVYMEHMQTDRSSGQGLTRYQQGSSTEKAEDMLRALVKSESIEAALNGWGAVHDQFKKNNNEIMVQLLDEQKQLWLHMAATVKDPQAAAGGCSQLVAMSVHEYLGWLWDRQLIDERQAESLRQRLRLSERQMQMARLGSLVRQGRWTDLEQLVMAPGGSSGGILGRSTAALVVAFCDVAEFCVEPALQGEGAAGRLFGRLLDKVEPERRVRLLVKMERMTEAEDLARSIRSDYLVSYVNAIKFSL